MCLCVMKHGKRVARSGSHSWPRLLNRQTRCAPIIRRSKHRGFSQEGCPDLCLQPVSGDSILGNHSRKRLPLTAAPASCRGEQELSTVSSAHSLSSTTKSITGLGLLLRTQELCTQEPLGPPNSKLVKLISSAQKVETSRPRTPACSCLLMSSTTYVEFWVLALPHHLE